jgi:hypothetical protein
MSELCDGLIRVISPELLQLDVLRSKSFDASEAFLDSAKRKYPGYEFSVKTETFAEISSPSGKSTRKRMEMRMVDPASVVSPPTMNITFVGEGAVKANEFLRTGKPNTWSAGEFINLRSDLPFFPQSSEGSVLSVGPIADPVARLVRVEIGDSPAISYPVMSFATVRRGIEEGEIGIKSDSEPLSFSIVVSFTDSLEYTLSLSFRFVGFTAQRCQRMIEAVDRIRQGTVVRVIDIREEIPTINLPTVPKPSDFDPFAKGIRKLYSLCSKVEDQFGVKFSMPSEVSEQDEASLEVLDCLLNGTDYKKSFSTKVTLVKGSGTQLDSQFLALDGGGELTYRVEVANYPGYFELFGLKIPTGMWGLNSKCLLEVSEKQKEMFRNAEEGYRLSCRLVSQGAVKLGWVTGPDPAPASSDNL